MKRFIMNIPEALHKRLKVVCVLQDTEMSEVVRKLVEDYVDRTERKLKTKK
jgi:hypothetical protein